MAYLKLSLIGSLAFCLFGSAHAGYAQLAPPPTWSKTATDTLVRVAANDASFPGGIRAGFASFNTGASLVQIPAAYRFAANAGRFAATAAFGWPAVIALAGGAVYQWYTDKDFEVSGNTWHKRFDGEMLVFKYRANGYGYPYRLTIQEAFNDYDINNPLPYGRYRTFTGEDASVPEAIYSVHYSPTSVTTNQKLTMQRIEELGQTSQLRPATREEFENEMDGTAVPLGVPQSWPLPGQWWPVEPKPIINPSPEPVPATDPLPIPVPEPLRIPQGEPIQVPNPNYDPVTNPEPYIWRQPVIDLVPSPTPDDPWRVDVQPKDITSPTYEPITDPESVPDPANDPNATPSEKSDLCADHPEILACAKPELDTPEGEPLDNIEKPISFMPETNWAGGSGFCPAPRHLAGANVDFKFDMVCDFMNGVRPVVLAIAAFVGGMILIGARGGAAE